MTTAPAVQRGQAPLLLPLSRSTTWSWRHSAGLRHALASRSSSSFSVSLGLWSPMVPAPGAGWVRAAPRLAQSGLRVWPGMPVVPRFAFSMFIFDRTAPIGSDIAAYLKDEKVSIHEIRLPPL